MQHKKIYKAFFKCRLCGEIFSTVTTENRIMATKIVSHICTNTNSDIALAPDSKETHMCKDGGIGMADFLGFNDAVTKADKIEKAFKLSMNIPNVDVDIDSVSQKMREKLLEQIQQETKSVTKDRYKYKKKSIQEIEEFIEQCLISKEDYICFFTEEKKYSDLELHIVKRKDFKNLERYLKQNPHIRVVSGVGFSKDGKMTLEDIYMFLEKDLEEIVEE